MGRIESSEWELMSSKVFYSCHVRIFFILVIFFFFLGKLN